MLQKGNIVTDYKGQFLSALKPGKDHSYVMRVRGTEVSDARLAVAAESQAVGA